MKRTSAGFSFLLTVSILSSAQAQMKCETVFEDAPAPYSFDYKSEMGASRYYREGVLYQRTNNKWYEIGKGEYIATTNTLVENLNRPSLDLLGHFEFPTTLVRKDVYYPNADTSYPSLVREIHIDKHVLEIVVPVGMEKYLDGLYQTVLQLPYARIESTKTIRLNSQSSKDDSYWRKSYKNFTETAANGGRGEIDIFNVMLSDLEHPTQRSVDVLRHELGHNIAKVVFGSVHPNRHYYNKAATDTHSVSEYGNNNWAEDFAEGIVAYLKSNGGKLNPSLKEKLKNRFAFFDEVFSYRTPQGGSVDLQIQLFDASRILAIDLNTGFGILLDLN